MDFHLYSYFIIIKNTFFTFVYIVCLMWLVSFSIVFTTLLFSLD